MQVQRGVVAAMLCGWALSVTALELTPSEAAGKRIYRDGVSVTGSTLSARIGPAGTPMPAAVVRCANCHGEDGRGRAEGGVRPPDITWRRLSAPYSQRLENGREYPPYNEAALGRALAQGIDPAGNRLDQAMPRFVMSMRDLADLTAYLKRIEDDHDPGLLPAVLRVGTLLPASGPYAGLGQTVAAVIRGAFDGINETGGIHGRRLELVVADPGADRASATAALRSLNDGDGVFALVAPLAPALDGVAGEVIDAAQIPTVGGVTQLTEGAGSRYLFDPLPGVQEQLLALGDFAAADLGLGNPAVAIVHPDDGRNRALAATLTQRLAQRGWTQVHPFAYRPGAFDAAAATAQLAQRGVQAVFYLGTNDDFGALAADAWHALQTPYLFAVSGQVGAAALKLPPPFSERVFLAYPLLPQDWTAQGVATLEAVRQRSGIGGRHGPLQVLALTSAQVLAEGLKRAGRDASRDKLVSALEQLYDFKTGLAPPLSFGPGQRLGAQGAHIVTVDLQKGAFKPTGQYVRLDRSDHSSKK